MLEGSDLITPDQHLVWVDSTFDRDGNTARKLDRKPPHSRRNEREVHLAKYMLDEFEEQIAARKKELDPAGWPNDAMLRHLDHEHRLPVGFITFYADQKRAFREIANEGDSWAACETAGRTSACGPTRWTNSKAVNARWCSSAWSPHLKVKEKGEKEAFEGKDRRVQPQPKESVAATWWIQKRRHPDNRNSVCALSRADQRRFLTSTKPSHHFGQPVYA